MTRRRASLLVFALGALLPGTALAQVAPQLWVIGNGEVIVNILGAIKGLINETGYKQLIMMIALTAFIFIAVAASTLTVKPEKIISYFIVLVLVLAVTFQSDMNVTVHDPVNNFTQVVTDVPLIVAFPATMISAVGNFFLRGVETLFNYPISFPDGSSNLSMHRSGQFNLMSQMIADGAKVRILDRQILASMHAYTQDCVVPWLYTGQLNFQTLTQSTDLWPDLLNTNQAMMTMYYGGTNPTGDVISCPNAHQNIGNDLAAHAPQLVGGAFDAFQYTDAVTFFEGAYASSYAYLADTGAPSTTAELLRHQAVINSFRDVSSDVMADLGGTDGAIYAINKAEAVVGQQTGWQVTADVFQTVVGYLYTVMQCFILAIMPFVLVSFIIPSYGAKMAMSVFKIMVWLALWQPVLGVVNFIIAGYLDQSIGGVLANGVNMENIRALSIQAEKAQAAAAMFGASVPLILYGLVSSGSFAITTFLSEGTGAIQARAAANAISSGSVSAEQRKMDSASARQNDLASSFSFGSMGVGLHNAYGPAEYGHLGGNAYDYAGRQMQKNAGLTESASHNEGAGTTIQNGQEFRNALMGGDNAASSRVMRRALDYFNGTTGSERQSAEQGLKASENVGSEQEVQQTEGAANLTGGTNTGELGASVNARLGSDALLGAGAGMISNGATSKQAGAAISKQISGSDNPAATKAAMAEGFQAFQNKGGVAPGLANALRMAGVNVQGNAGIKATSSNSDTTEENVRSQSETGTSGQVGGFAADSTSAAKEIAAGWKTSFVDAMDRQSGEVYSDTATQAEGTSTFDAATISDATQTTGSMAVQTPSFISLSEATGTQARVTDQMAGIQDKVDQGTQAVKGRADELQARAQSTLADAADAGDMDQLRNLMSENMQDIDNALANVDVSALPPEMREFLANSRQGLEDVQAQVSNVVAAAQANNMISSEPVASMLNSAKSYLDGMATFFSGGSGWDLSTMGGIGESIRSQFEAARETFNQSYMTLQGVVEEGQANNGFIGMNDRDAQEALEAMVAALGDAQELGIAYANQAADVQTGAFNELTGAPPETGTPQTPQTAQFY